MQNRYNLLRTFPCQFWWKSILFRGAFDTLIILTCAAHVAFFSVTYWFIQIIITWTKWIRGDIIKVLVKMITGNFPLIFKLRSFTVALASRIESWFVCTIIIEFIWQWRGASCLSKRSSDWLISVVVMVENLFFAF